MSGSRISAVTAFLLWTLFCVYGAGSGLLNLFPAISEGLLAESMLRLGITVTIWLIIWFAGIFTTFFIAILIRRRR